MATNGPEMRSETDKKLTSRSDGSAILVTDQSRRRLKTRLGRDRFNRVERPIVDVAEQWDATKLPGALSEDGETRFYRCESSFTSEVTIHSFRSLQVAFGDEFIVVPDNAPYFASKKVRAFAEWRGSSCVTCRGIRHRSTRLRSGGDS